MTLISPVRTRVLILVRAELEVRAEGAARDPKSHAPRPVSIRYLFKSSATRVPLPGPHWLVRTGDIGNVVGEAYSERLPSL